MRARAAQSYDVIVIGGAIAGASAAILLRRALPSSVPFADAVHNVGAATLAVAALTQGPLELLGPGTVDRLHEPYRASAYPELPELIEAGYVYIAQPPLYSIKAGTKMQWAYNDARLEEIKQELESLFPLGEIPADDDVAEAVVVFLSDRMRMVTGEFLRVDAGQLKRL